jgi:hypothetical protein
MRVMQPHDPYRAPQAPLDGGGAPSAMKCPKCGASSASKVSFTWWGGLLGPRLFHVVKCNQCSTQYNGKTGGTLTKTIIFYQLAALLILGLLFAALFLTMNEYGR